VLLAEVVDTSAAVGATRSRKAKVASLADLLRRLDGDGGEVEAAVGFLTGVPRQGRIGVGWRTAFAVEVEPAASPTLTIREVDEAFTSLAATSGAGSVGARRAILEALFGRATEREAEYVRALLTGGIRQGALAGVVTDAVAQASGLPLADVRRVAMLTGDLGRTAVLALHGGADGLASARLTLLNPVEPMLAATAADVADALAKTGEASVEWKLDGARVQVHRQGEDVRIFTRNLNDITERLAPVVALVRGLPGQAFILDGEWLWFDEAEQRPRPFQESMSAFGSGDGGGPASVAASLVRFFDVLHRDGVDLIDEPLHVRHGHLDELVGPLAIPRVSTSRVDEAQAMLEQALAAGHEGVMVKALDSTYEAGRRGGVWRKVKPVRTLDLVVLAAEWGHGRRQGWLSNLWLGARDPDGGFVMVGKTFKGLTDELLTWQTAALLERETHRDGIVVHVRPELVVEIALDGVQASTRYAGGVALRFARVKAYRPDKAPADADTIEAVQAIRTGG